MESSKKYISAPEIPGEIETVEVSSRTAILDWQREHRGYLDGFYLEMNPPDGVIEQPRSSTEKQREIVGLKPGKRYGVKVHSTAYGLLRFVLKQFRQNLTFVTCFNIHYCTVRVLFGFSRTVLSNFG